MPDVHATAVLDGEVELAEDVVIGPHCVLTGPITIGRGSRLIGNVYLQGPMTLGAGNTIYPFVCLGFAPQHTACDPCAPGRGLEIGDDNTFREQVTVHRAFTDEGPTRIGDRNYFMAASHAGHDCQIGSDCVVVNAVLLGGHVVVADRVMLNGGSKVHQFCRIGRGAMLAGGVTSTMDVPPFFVITGTNICGSVNLIGMRRRGMPSDQVDDVRWVYRTLYRRGLPLSTAVEHLQERAHRPIVAEYIEFIRASKRGICPARERPIRGSQGQIVAAAEQRQL